MKETGVVRRIDELGRIVVPKEIRKTLRIKEGDALEIYVDGECVVLKKYSSIEGLQKVAVELAEAIEETTELACVIFDTDNVVATGGKRSGKLMSTKIQNNLLELIKERREYYQDARNSSSKINVFFSDHETRSIAVFPIISGGDIYGGLCVMGTESSISKDKLLVARSGVNFLCKGIM